MAAVTAPAATISPAAGSQPAASGPFPAYRGGATRLRSDRVFDLPTIVRLHDFLPNDGLRSWVLTGIITSAAFVLRLSLIHI